MKYTINTPFERIEMKKYVISVLVAADKLFDAMVLGMFYGFGATIGVATAITWFK